MVTVSIAGSGNPIQVNWSQGMNVQQAMEEAYATNPSGFVYALQYFGEYGYLAIMFNQTFETLIPTESPYYYWELFVNGSPSQNGIDATILNDTDVVTFELTLYIPSLHANTLLGKKHKMKLFSSSMA